LGSAGAKDGLALMLLSGVVDLSGSPSAQVMHSSAITLDFV
jgi:hypothetical protein